MEVVARKRKRETAMEDVDFRRWGDMEPDILSEIFKRLGRISDLTSAIVYVRCSAVCSTWRSVILDYSSRVFTTLDLLRMKIDFIPSQYKPYVYVTSKSDLALSHVLKVSLGFSMGNITSLLFNRNLYVPDHLLIYEAERCPKLRRLVLPDWNRITKTGMCKALGCWKDFESLTIPALEDPQYLMEEISKNCKNFRELKIIQGECTRLFASTLVSSLPNLSVLSLQCTKMRKEALLVLLGGLRHLQVLNISHCLVIDVPTPRYYKKILDKLDPFTLNMASLLLRFITCTQLDHCIMCQRIRVDMGIIKMRKGFRNKMRSTPFLFN